MEQIYKLREIEPFSVEVDNSTMIALKDLEGYKIDPVLVSPAAYSLIVLSDESDTTTQLIRKYKDEFGFEFQEKDVKTLFEFLDNAYMLDSPKFKEYAVRVNNSFNSSRTKKAKFAGLSYPDNPRKLTAKLNTIFEEIQSVSTINEADSQNISEPQAIIVPHIDFKIGAKMMAMAWDKVRTYNYDRIVILGTGHSLLNDFYACIDKDFETPIGTIKVDSKFLSKFEESLSEDISAQQLAYKNEHSVEFPLLFIKHLFADNRSLKIVPILLAFPENLEQEDGDASFNLKRIDHFSKILKSTIATSPGKTLIVASIDFAHVGLRFGGNLDSLNEQNLKLIKENDLQVIELLSTWDKSKFSEHMATTNHKYRICGFAPLYILLSLIRSKNVKLLSYDQSIEKDTASVVTFASLSCY
ncbi:MAG: AmmeMemoRadiSam system protein B [Nitrospinota bacterium]